MNEELIQKVIDLAMALGKGSSVTIQAHCEWNKNNEWKLADKVWNNRYVASFQIKEGFPYGIKGTGMTPDEALADLYKNLEKYAKEMINKVLKADPDIL